jgi:hypothetical protein
MSSFRTLRSFRTLSAVAVAALVSAACGSDGPTYPSVFEPDVLRDQVGSAEAALEAPASASFIMSGYAIDDALFDLGGGALLTAPALMLEAEATGPARLAARVRQQVELRSADAIPAIALGRTFVWDDETSGYIMSELTGAPANGVRFHLYLMDAETELPVLPLVQVGYADLTRTVSNDRVTARVEVWTGTVTPAKVIDYSATISGSVTAPAFTVLGFARNAADSLAFNLTTTFSLANETVTVDWRTALPSRGLTSRLRQTISFADEDLSFGLEAWVQSSSGRVDLIGTVHAMQPSTLQVRVNGRLFATIAFDAMSEAPPTITNAGGEPLTAAEEQALAEIFDWFADSFEVYAVLLSPVSTLLDQ